MKINVILRQLKYLKEPKIHKILFINSGEKKGKKKVIYAYIERRKSVKVFEITLIFLITTTTSLDND